MLPTRQVTMPVLFRLGLPSKTSRIAVLLFLVALLSAVTSIETTRIVLAGAKSWVVGHFDWLFVGVANLAIACVLIVAIHPSGKLRLGAEDARPEFGRVAWFAMLFSAGLASELLYFATAEPILHQQANPWLTSVSSAPEATTTAMRMTVLHWGIHGWALYVIAGLAISVYAYRHDRRLTFRTALHPVLGPVWIDRWPGKAVDLLAVIGTVCGVATSLGLSAGSMNATLASIFAVPVGTSSQVAIVFVVCGLGVFSALSGLTHGVKWMSEINVGVSAVLLVGLVVLGPTLEIGELLMRTLLDYAANAIPAGLFIGESARDRAWQADWTIFYWGWWLAWTPFVSLFIARISRGRTIREFVVVVLIVPALVTLVWMVAFGGTAIAQEAMMPGSISDVVNRDYSLGLVAVLESLGSPTTARFLIGTTAFLLFTWLVTSIDSATLVICHLLGSDGIPAAKIFWGLVLASVAAVLLRAGGLDALQAASIVTGLPLAGVILLLSGGLLWSLVRGRI